MYLKYSGEGTYGIVYKAKDKVDKEFYNIDIQDEYTNTNTNTKNPNSNTNTNANTN